MRARDCHEKQLERQHDWKKNDNSVHQRRENTTAHAITGTYMRVLMIVAQRHLHLHIRFRWVSCSHSPAQSSGLPPSCSPSFLVRGIGRSTPSHQNNGSKNPPKKNQAWSGISSRSSAQVSTHGWGRCARFFRGSIRLPPDIRDAFEIVRWTEGARGVKMAERGIEVWDSLRESGRFPP